jgi:hypothetical protein
MVDLQLHILKRIRGHTYSDEKTWRFAQTSEHWDYLFLAKENAL